jgi:hypothetical protein
MKFLRAVALYALSVAGFAIGGVLVVSAVLQAMIVDQIYAPLDITLIGLFGLGLISLSLWLWTRASGIWRSSSESPPKLP